MLEVGRWTPKMPGIVGHCDVAEATLEESRLHCEHRGMSVKIQERL